jgi:hypothetical protein
VFREGPIGRHEAHEHLRDRDANPLSAAAVPDKGWRLLEEDRTFFRDPPSAEFGDTQP